MKVYLDRKNDLTKAEGEYDRKKGTLIVKKGSVVSKEVRYSNTFHGSQAIEKLRSQYVIDGIVHKDVAFSSASAAANFVCGSSTNGLIAWKTDKGIKLKDII